MPRMVSVASIMAGARERASDVAGRLAGDSVVIGFIETAFGMYYQMLVNADPAYFQAESPFSTVVNQKAYSLPANWFGTMHVGRLVGSHYDKLERLNVDEVFDYAIPGTPCKYQIEGGQLALYPTPNAVVTMKHIYVPSWTKITLDTQEIDGLLGHEALIEVEVAIRLKGKEEAEKTDLIAERKFLLGRLAEQALQRNIVDAQVAGEKMIDEIHNGDYSRYPELW